MFLTFPSTKFHNEKVFHIAALFVSPKPLFSVDHRICVHCSFGATKLAGGHLVSISPVPFQTRPSAGLSDCRLPGVVSEVIVRRFERSCARAPVWRGVRPRLCWVRGLSACQQLIFSIGGMAPVVLRSEMNAERRRSMYVCKAQAFECPSR